MNKAILMVAILIHLTGKALWAYDVRIVAEFRSPLAGTFTYTRRVSGREAERIGHLTDQDLRPHLLAARKALAEREGYTERVYGPDHYKLPAGVKFYGITVLDTESGTSLYSSPN